MKNTLLLVASISAVTGLQAQKKFSYKSDTFHKKILYTYLPALTEVQYAKTYSIRVFDTNANPITFGNASQKPEIETTGYLTGLRQLENGGDFSIEVNTAYVRTTGNEVHEITSTTAPAVTTFQYHVNYLASYHLVITDNAEKTVLIDTTFEIGSFAKYPNDFGKSEPPTVDQLKKMYAAETTRPDFDTYMKHACVRNLIAVPLKIELMGLLRKSLASFSLPFAQLKTKDPDFAELDSAQAFLETAVKIINKYHADGLDEINWHSEEVQKLLLKSHSIYSGFFHSPMLLRIEDEDTKKKFLDGLAVNVFYLDVMVGKFNEARILIAATGGFTLSAADIKDADAGAAPLYSSLGSFVPTDAQKMYYAMHIFEDVLWRESTYLEKHREFYHFY